MRSDRPRRRSAHGARTFAVALCATLGLGLALAPASALAAGTIDFFDNFNGTFALTFTAGDGDANSLVIAGTGDVATFTDVVPIMVSDFSDPGCTGSGTTTVVCTATGIVIFADLGDNADRGEITGTAATLVSGGGGPDMLIGGPGDDGLFGGNADSAGDDISGGPGSDSFLLGRTDGPDVIRGGPGIDGVRATSIFLLPDYNYTLNDGLANDGEGTQSATLLEVEDITTGEGSDVVRGTDGPNVINTGDGNENVDGLGGTDLISLGAHDDTVEARDGFSDRILCGEGTDTARVDQLDVLSGCENVTTSFVTPAGTPPPLPPPDVPPLLPADPGPTPAAPILVPARDRTGPVCTMSAPGTIGDPSRAITVTETCNEPSSLQMTLTAQLRGRVVAARPGDVILAQRSLSRRSGRVRVTLRIARRFRAALGRRARITVRVAATDAAGNRTARSRTIRLRRR